MIPFTHQISIYKLSTLNDMETYDAVPTYENIDAVIFPAGPEIQAVYPGEGAFIANQMTVFDDVVIANGDRIVADGFVGTVRGIPAVYHVNGHHHIECVVLTEAGS